MRLETRITRRAVVCVDPHHRQRRRLLDHGDRYSVEIRDASNPSGWGEGKGGARPGACFVLALEVMDNLPHDRVARPRADDRAGEEEEGGGWMETTVEERWVRREGGEGAEAMLREVERPLSGAGGATFTALHSTLTWIVGNWRDGFDSLLPAPESPSLSHTL